jgi:dihydrofolate reductase
MRKVSVFNHVTLDGYFTDKNSDMSWAHKNADAEWNAFTEANASGGGMLLFGRVTYDLMASFWPTPQAAQMMPKIAERMNSMPKIVFSRTMKTADWNNTTVVSGDIAAEVRALKNLDGPEMVLFGSGTIVSQLTDAGVIDEYQLVVNPLALGAGRTMFQDVKEPVKLKLMSSRQFKNGNVLNTYQRA